MERTTISLPVELVERLRALASKRGTSVDEIIREVVKEEVSPVGKRRPRLGTFDSGFTDTSELASEGPIPPLSWR